MEKTEQESLAEVDGMSEIMLYFLIDAIGAFTWRMNHDYAHGRIPEDDMVAINKDIERLRVKQDRAVKNLPRFGVNPLEDGKTTAEYWAWYKWWNHWHKDELTNEQWDELNQKMNEKADLSSYRPSGDWHALVEKKT